MKKTAYDMKVVSELAKPKKLKEQEEQLKDLLSVLPTLRKHDIDGEIQKRVRQLRSGRKTKAFTLELTRKFHGETISVKAQVEKTADKFAIARQLKNQIRDQIKKRRKDSRELTKDSEGNLVPIIEQYTFREGVTVPKQDGTYLEEGSFLKALMKKIRAGMQKNKTPTTKDLYIGIEIEIAAKESRETLCDRLFEAGLGKYVTVKDDGSIGSEEHTGVTSKLKAEYPHAHEICILAKQSEVEDIVKKMCKVFVEKLHVGVDKTCGLHVHLDMRNRVVETCFNNLVLSQQFLYAMLPAQRRSSRYCYPTKGAQWRNLDSRYHGINQQAYQKYGTLELRMHSGTTNEAKINNWIKLLIAIVEAPKMGVAPTTIEAFQAAVNFNNTVAEYVKSRVAKFAKQHKETTPSVEQPGTMPEISSITGATADTLQDENSEVA